MFENSVVELPLDIVEEIIFGLPEGVWQQLMGKFVSFSDVNFPQDVAHQKVLQSVDFSRSY